MKTLLPKKSAVRRRGISVQSLLTTFCLLTILLLSYNSNGQTIFNYTNTTASIPTGFTLTNNVAANAIDQTTFLLLDAGSPSDLIVTPNYDLSAYTTATITVQVATFGSGTNFPMKVEFSTNGGTTWNATTYTTATPTSSTYIAGGPIVITQSFTSVTKFRFSNNGSSGRGVRVQSLKLDASGSTSITSTMSGNWSNTATWVGGVVPSSSSSVVIAAGHTVTMDVTTGGINTRNAGTTTTVAATATLATNVTYFNNGGTTINGNFQLNSGGWVSDAVGTNGLVYGAAGTLIFNTPYTANNGNYWPTGSGPVNVTVNSGSALDLGFARTVSGVFQTSSTVTNPGNLTINGTLQLNGGYGWSGTGNPVYGIGSLLKYNSGGTPGRAAEWTASSGTLGTTAGYPNNVQVSNNTAINFPNGSSSNFKANGSVTIDSGSALYQNFSGGSAGLIIGSDLLLNGSLVLGTTSGDITVGGNWTRGATGAFTPNSRAALFNGTGTQTITVTGGGIETFNYLLVQGSGTLKLATGTSVTVNSAGGLTLSSTNATSTIDLNGQTLTVSGGGNLELSGGARLITSSASGGIFLVSGVSLTVTNGGSLSFAATNTTLKLTNGFNAGLGLTTVNGVLQIDPSGFITTNPPKYGAASLLKYNTGGVFGRGIEWSVGTGTIAVTAGYPNDIQVSGSTTLNVPNVGGAAFTTNLALARDLTVDTGSALYMDYGNGGNKSASLTVGRNFSLSGSLSLGDAVGGDMNVAGSWTNAGTFLPNSRAVQFNGSAAQTLTGATTFGYLTINNAAGVTLQSTTSSIVVSQTLALTSGKITLGTNNLTISSTNAISGVSASNYVATNGTGQLKRTVGGSAVVFPVGAAAYNPITFTNSGTSDVYGVRVIDGAITTGANNTKTVSRRWVTTEAVAGGSSLAVVAQYNTGEPNTGFAAATDPFIGFYNGTAWTQVAATAGGASPFTFTSLANSSPSDLTTATTQYFALGKDNAFISIASKLVITAITPTSPTAGSVFTVTVQSQDNYGTVKPVTANTAFSLSTNGNAGTIGGTITGTINAATSSVVVSGVTLPTAGTLVTITATRTSGDVVTAGVSNAFTVLAAASQLAFGTVPNGNVNLNLASFTVEARRPDNSLDNTFTGNVTISKATGPGALSGTLTVAAAGGIATFNAAQLDTAGSYTLSAASGSLTAATSNSFTITLVPISIFANTITGTNPSTSNPYIIGQTFDTHITVSGVGRGTGISAATANDRYSAAGWDSPAFDSNDYFTFTLTPNAGYYIDFSDLVYSNQRSASGPTNVSMRSSLDGFTADIGSLSTGATAATFTVSLAAAAYDMVPAAITFRIYGYNASGSTGTFSVNDFIFNGNSVCVQPVAYTVTGGGNYCVGGTGVPVGLSGSQIGVSYQLKLNGSDTGSAIPGTGAALSFGDQTSVGTYTVVATNINGGCNYTLNMTGNAAVTWTATTTWLGGTSTSWITPANWSCGVPFASSAVTIGTGTFAPEITNSPTVASLTINSGASLRVVAAHNLTVTGSIGNNGTMTIENNANLIQTNDVNNTGSGFTVVYRNSAQIMRQDYTLWSSPVEGQQLQAFSPMTLSNRFYAYDNIGDTDPSNDIYVPESATNNFAEGIGYLIRVANNHPTTATAWPGVFTGTEAHNGTKNIAAISGAYYAIGNPYPSTISANQFIADNNLTDALYFWRKTNNVLQTTFPTSTYATYTYAGGVGNGDPNPDDPLALEPNGFIQVGQGFIAQAASSQLSFNNGQRTGNNGDQFLRINESERHRIWLSLSNSVSGINKMMVAYMAGATQSVDAAIDGRYFNDSPTALNSVINNEEFAIQGRALPFDTADVVPLAFKTISAGNYTIALDHFDGLFTGDHEIFLKDNLTGTVHNLRTAPYTFATDAGNFNTRFEIVYQAPLATEIPTLTANQVIVYKQQDNVVINTGKVQMAKVSVYDIRGRLLVEKDHINASEIKIATGNTNQVLIVKIVSDKNETVTKKVVN
jgi:hypothetical protein